MRLTPSANSCLPWPILKDFFHCNYDTVSITSANNHNKYTNIGVNYDKKFMALSPCYKTCYNVITLL